jgi:hypothetical protein
MEEAMRKILITALLVMLLAGHAHADALWYALESGSKVDLTTGGSVNLTGRIALAMCGGKNPNSKGTRILYPIYSVQIDNLPEILVTHISDSNKHIALFGGAGEVDVSGKLSMIAYRNEKLFSVDWVIQQQLEQDSGNEAMVYNRMLQLDRKQQSRVLSQDNQQACPDKIELHMLAKDIWRTFKPQQMTSSTGEQHTETVTSSYKEEVIANVTIVATAIPSSLEKIDESVYKRSKLAEGPYNQSVPALPNVGQRLGKPIPPEWHSINRNKTE